MWKTLDGSDPDPVWPDGITVRTYEPRDAGGSSSSSTTPTSPGTRTTSPRPRRLGGWYDRRLGLRSRRRGPRRERRGFVGCALHWRTRLGEGPRRPPSRIAAAGSARRSSATASGSSPGAAWTGRAEGRRANPTGAIRLYERLGFVIDRREEVRAAVPVNSAATCSLLRWLRRQLRQPDRLREHLEAAIENDDPAEARRSVRISTSPTPNATTSSR